MKRYFKKKKIDFLIIHELDHYTISPTKCKYCFLGNTPRIIMGSQIPRNPVSRSGPGFIFWSIQFLPRGKNKKNVLGL